MSARPVIIWGAGRIGRGFNAEVFDRPGYALTFVDMVRPLIDSLRAAGGYTIYKAEPGGISSVRVENFDALHIDDGGQIMRRMLRPNPIVCAAVHASMLGSLADMLSPYIRARALKMPDDPMDILLNVNMMLPDRAFRAALERVFEGEPAVLSYLGSKVGLVATVVMRIVPMTPERYRKIDPLALFTNGYAQLVADRHGFVGPLPQLPMLRLTERIEAEEVRKIYTLNMAHAAAAYLGIPQGLGLSADAAEHPKIGPMLLRALEESAVGLCGEYGFSAADMAAWNQKMMALIANRHVGDDLMRLGADSLRKLGPDDRLVGAARLAIKHAGRPETIARAIRMGFEYENADEGTQTVRRIYAQKGLQGALLEVCGLTTDEPLYDMIQDA
jgi:mannitol-1-phosphate 5-dehydrogenase